MPDLPTSGQRLAELRRRSEWRARVRDFWRPPKPPPTTASRCSSPPAFMRFVVRSRESASRRAQLDATGAHTHFETRLRPRSRALHD